MSIPPCLYARLFFGLLASALLRSGVAAAEERAVRNRAEPVPTPGAVPLIEARDLFQPWRATDPLLPYMQRYSLAPPPQSPDEPFSVTEFRRRPAAAGRDPKPADVDSAPMLRGTTVWQRIGDFKAHNRVRLITLWESTASTLSLQTGKKGYPSLQWTSRTMSRGEASRGLFDRFIATSLQHQDLQRRAPTPAGGRPPLRPETPAKADDGR